MVYEVKRAELCYYVARNKDVAFSEAPPTLTVPLAVTRAGGKETVGLLSGNCSGKAFMTKI